MKNLSERSLLGAALLLTFVSYEGHAGDRAAVAAAFSIDRATVDSPHATTQDLKAPRKRLFRTAAAGGKGGNDFEELPEIRWRLVAVVVCAGRYVDEIWSIWSGPDVPTGLRNRRCRSGAKNVFELKLGESLTMVRLRAGAWVDAIELVTSLGRRRWFGNSVGGVGVSTCEFDRNYRLSKEVVGFRGRRGAYLDALGFIVRVEGERIPDPPFSCSDFVASP